ncbi:hypothetical protein AHAS_Ahas02G0066000 [Arachis hypogaea]
MNTNPDWESSSSSSESESSESECDNEVVDMKKNMKVGVAVANSPPKAETMIYTPPLLPEDVSANDHHHKAMELFSRNNDISVGSINGSLKNESTAVIITESILQKRIEVCMGNKCKKSGSIALLQEFERVVGANAAAVVGCKCMGKCKSAPNVRIQNSTADKIAKGFNDSVKVLANPLFVGVALEDVETIVARFLGENQEKPSLCPFELDSKIYMACLAVTTSLNSNLRALLEKANRRSDLAPLNLDKFELQIC